MKVYRAENASRGTILADRVFSAESFAARCRGLLGTRELGTGEGVWLRPCHAIHTCFMRYAIDALFLDKENRLLHAGTYAPWRMSRYVPQSRGVLELAAGALARSGTRPGDQIRLSIREDLN